MQKQTHVQSARSFIRKLLISGRTLSPSRGTPHVLAAINKITHSKPQQKEELTQELWTRHHRPRPRHTPVFLRKSSSHLSPYRGLRSRLPQHLIPSFPVPPLISFKTKVFLILQTTYADYENRNINKRKEKRSIAHAIPAHKNNTLSGCLFLSSPFSCAHVAMDFMCLYSDFPA